MTTQTDTQAPVVVVDQQSAALVKTGMDLVLKGKTTLSDLFYSITTPDSVPPIDKTPPVPMKLSEEVLAAIKRLPEVFGKVVVHTDRRLTAPELEAIVQERTTIDLVEKALKKRKEESIREVLANHMDHLVDNDPEHPTRMDRNGHYAPYETQELSVDGTGMKVQRYATGGKPNLTIAHVEALHEAGQIDRPTYLAITKKPEVPRVLDEVGLHRAIQKNPSLFFLLATKAEATLPSTTVKVLKDN